MPCPECGAPGVHDVEGCESLFHEVAGWEFSHAALFRVHGLTVDVYSLQHPDRYMKSSKSAAAHLAGACWRIEYGGGPDASHAISAWLDGRRELPRVEPPPPGGRGTLTIRHVHEGGGGAEHADRVRTWAEEVWRAWEVGHDQARSWVAALVGEDVASVRAPKDAAEGRTHD